MLDPAPRQAAGAGGPLLLLTTDDAIADEVRRAAAAAGAALDQRSVSGEVRAAWARAVLVIVGTDQVGALAALALPRRREVYVAARQPDRAVTSSSPTIETRWMSAALDLGAERVVTLPAEVSTLADRLADAIETRAEPALTVATIGGRGGAGSTALAVAVAVRGSARGRRVALVDADPLGGGIDLAAGCEEEPGYRWPALARSRGRVDGATVLNALPRAREVAVLSHDRRDPSEIGAAAMSAVTAALARTCDLVVIDLPRTASPASAAALHQAAITYLLVPAEIRATASAARLAREVGTLASDLRLVIRGSGTRGLDAYAIAEAIGAPLAVQGGLDPRVARELEAGDLPGRHTRSPLGRLADRLLDDAARRAT
jgi:secretion/DNA translocation related CpaE-like protein